MALDVETLRFTAVFEDGASAGLAAATKRTDDLATATAAVDTVATRTGKTYEAVNRRLDEQAVLTAKVIKINRDHEQSVQAINRALEVGRVDQEQSIEQTRRAGLVRDQDLQKARDSAAAMAERFGVAGAAVAQAGVSAGASAFAMRQLGVQSMQAASSIASGQPIFTTLVQQGHQVVDVMLSTGTGFSLVGQAAKSVAAALLTPTAAAIAVGVAFAAIVIHASDLDAQSRALSINLRAVGRDGEIAASGLQSYVRVLQNGGIARNDAVSILSTLSRNPALGSAQIGQVAGLTADTATAVGTDPQTAAKRLGDAAGGSYSAIKSLDDELNILTADQRVAVRVMLEHGQRTEAVTLVMDQLNKQVKGLDHDALTPMTASLREMSNAWGSFADAVVKNGAVKWYLDYLASVVKGTTNIVTATGSSNSGSSVSQLQADMAKIETQLSSRDSYGDLQITGAARQILSDRVTGMRSEILGLTMSNQSFAGSPNDVGGSYVGTSGYGESQRQSKELQPSQQAVADAQRLARAGPAGRSTAQAEIDAENIIRDKGLTGLAMEEQRRLSLKKVIIEEGAARQEEMDVILRQTTAEMALVRASDEGRASMLRARAQAEAHAQAATKGGVAEAALADAILNRNAAQEASKGAQQLLDMNEQIAATEKLIVAEKSGDRATYYATLDQKIRDATKSLVANRDAATDPKIKAALTAEVVLMGQKIEKQQLLNADSDAAKQIRAGQGMLSDLKAEGELIGVSAEQRERELAALRTIRSLISGGKAADADSLTDTQKALVEQSRTIASANYQLRQQQSLYDGIAQAASQAFDQVGSAITNAFIGGQRAAVNWGNVARGVATSVIQQMLKLSVVNPLMNSFTGGSLPSLSMFGGGGLFSMGESARPSADFVGPMPADSGVGGLFSQGSGLSNAFNGSQSVFSGGSMMASLGGAAAGFGLGNMASSLMRTGNTQQGMVGSGLGGLAGAAIFGPIGGVVGGLLGGIVGSLFGPGKAHHGWSYDVTTDSTGMLGVDNAHIDSIAKEQYAADTAEMAKVNDWLKANGLKASGSYQVGGNNAGVMPGSLDTGFSALRFTSTDAKFNGQLAGREFSDPTNLNDFQTLVQQTIPALIGGDGSIKTAIDALTKTFEDAITKAKAFGLATDDLSAAQAKQTQAARDAIALVVSQAETGYQSRLLAATGHTAEANILNFDLQASQQRATAAKQLTDAFGDAYASTTDYARILGELNTALDAERKSVVDGPRLQAASAAMGVVSSLRTFAQGLSTSGASPLSPQAQLLSAQRQFDAVAGSAIQGDASSLSQVQSYATNLLTVSRNVNGSGLAYATDFSHVVDMLSQAASQSADTLTASFLAATTQNQTDQLVTAIGNLQDEVTKLRTEVAQNTSAPARVAA